MKIALVIHPIQDYGGIINHLETLALGLKNLGHKVNFHSLHYQNSFKQITEDEDLLRGTNSHWHKGVFCAISQQSGWNAIPHKHKLLYKNRSDRIRTKKVLSKYDLIIWEIPVPTKSKANQGNYIWTKLYNFTNNIAVIHDGNFLSTPWIYEIKSKLLGLACVHDAAYNSAQNIDIPRSLILNPQILNDVDCKYFYNKKRKGFLSLQVFKGLKHVDDLIRSIPYMSNELIKIIAGGGIEQRYMVSKDKIKPKYICNKNNDPDVPDSYVGQPIWERATWSGMSYLGFVTPSLRDEILFNLRTFVDSSWTKKYDDFGGHFNRTTIEAMMFGTIPLMTDFGVTSDSIISPDKNYIVIPHKSTPKEYAKIVESASNLSRLKSSRIIENNFNILHNFNYIDVARDFIKLYKGKKCGYYNNIKTGEYNEDMKSKSDKLMKEFFGKPPYPDLIKRNVGRK